MQISGTMPSDVVGFSIKRNQTHDGREAYADFEIGVDEAKAKSSFGEEFHTLAFSTLEVRETGDGTQSNSFLQDTIKPNNRFVYEPHMIELYEPKKDADDKGKKKADEDREPIAKIEAKPELLSIQTCDGVARVTAKIRIPFDVSKAGAISKLVQSVGKMLDLSFNLKQQKLGFEIKKGGKADDANEEAAG